MGGGTLGDIGNALKNTGGQIVEAANDAVKAGATIVAAPVIVADAVIKGKPVDQAIAGAGQQVIDAHTNAARDAAKAGGTTANLQNHILIDLAGAVAGPEGEKIVQYLVAGNQYQNNIASAVPQVLLKNGQPLTMEEAALAPIAGILAGALTSSVEILEKHAQPLPKLIRLSFSEYFEKELLANTKYWVGDFGITLPELVNGFQSFMGNHKHAVTVGHIIVFSVEPGATDTDLHWWAHELQHVKQFADRGINQFALDYVRDANGLETDAEETAERISQAV